MVSTPLEFALNPVGIDDFFHTHWEKSPCLVQRENPSYFDDLITLEKLDEVIAFSGLRYPSYRIIAEQKSKPPRAFSVAKTPHRETTSSILNEIYDEYGRGATLLFQTIDKRLLNLKDFCERLTDLFKFPVHSNAYLTPPDAQGFSCHYDTHDVLLLQCHGKKRWRVWNSVICNPMKTQKYSVTSDYLNKVKSTTNPLIDCTLSAGDTLYIPRGFPHEGYSLESDSLHLTVGFFPNRALDMAQAKVVEAIQYLSETDEFKRSVTRFMQNSVNANEYIKSLSDAITEGISNKDEQPK